MPPRQNPRRNVGAPVRFEDDETYLIERPRDSTKPAWPKLLAQSTVPYNHTLSPVEWNTRPLDQPFLQITKTALNNRDEVGAHNTRKEEESSKHLRFEDHDDLDMATSESEREDNGDDHACTGDHRALTSTIPTWSALEPALQLSMYEYVFSFIQIQQLDEPAKSQKTDEIRGQAAEVLGLSKHELSDIEPQRAFRTANPLTEEFLQDQWKDEEKAAINGEDLLSKDLSQYRDRWQAINDRYTALMVHICRYKYANEGAVELAKAYLRAHGLKPKLVGEWTEGEEEITMVLVSTQPSNPRSPMLLPVYQSSVVRRDAQQLPSIAVSTLDAVSQRPQESTISELQTQLSSQPHSSSLEIKSAEGLARSHTPKPIRPRSLQDNHRDCPAVHPSDILLRVNFNGKAEVRKKPSKRRAASQLGPSYPNDCMSGKRVVVLEDGTVGFDIATKPTPEVESLLRTGLEANRRGNATHLTNRMQESAKVPSPTLRPRLRRFSDLLLGIDLDHMPAATTGNVAMDGEERQTLSLTSAPPRPVWSPIESPDDPKSPSPGPIKSTLKPEMNAKSTSVVNTLLPLRSVESQQKSQSARSAAGEYPPLPFDLRTNLLDTISAKGNLTSAPTPSSRHERASSAPPLSPDPTNDGHDSGIGTSRATSTEPDIAKRENRSPLKQPQQLRKHKVTMANRKIGKGARGGPGSYKKKQKTSKELAAVGLPLPLLETANISTSGGTSHVA